MSVKSSQSVNPPVACEGVTYAYPSGSVPVPAVGQLGNSVATNTGAVVTPISGSNVTQAYLTLGGVGAGYQAGTYIAFGSSVIDSITGDIASFIRILDSATGLSILASSSTIFFGAATPGQYQSIQPFMIFTASQSFYAVSYFQSGGAGGTGTPIDVGALSLIRIA
jgi:hypothetical protein